MLFNSWQYLIFLPAVFIVYWITPFKWRWVPLLIASYYFYMSWNTELVLLISSTTLVSYLCARFIDNTKDAKQRKLWLMLGCTFGLLILFYFKYFNFFSDSVTAVLRAFSLPVDDFTVNVLLPVGISFYTFQTISYVVDVYRGKLKAERHLGIYALYVSFFPQLVAGPIERAVKLLPQLHKRQYLTYNYFTDGLRLMVYGFFKKMFVADFLAQYVDRVYDNLAGFSTLTIIVATFFFAIQIYCDFSGYSDIARGSAKLLGYDLMLNFNVPYFSTSIGDFWARWHISLSGFLRDYIYIPLGGSRKGAVRTAINLGITFLLSGLWHGAAWTFILWGAYHAALQVFDRILKSAQKRFFENTKIPFARLFGTVFTFFLVCCGWVIFRVQSLSEIVFIIRSFFSTSPFLLFDFGSVLNQLDFNTLRVTELIIGLLLLFVGDFYLFKNKEGNIICCSKNKVVRHAFTYIFAFLTVYSFLALGTEQVAEFLYFQF